jgi:Holliday junction resolvase
MVLFSRNPGKYNSVIPTKLKPPKPLFYMKPYTKGVRFERDLLHFFNHKGFSVLRVPSSGSSVSPVDIIAIKKGLIIAIECKAWAKKPRIEKKSLQKFRMWVDRAGALGFIAWKKPRNEWLFLRIDDAENGNYEDENWFRMENLLNALDFR